MIEFWRDVKGYEGLYQVSNAGRIRSLRRIASDGRHLSGKILSPSTDSYGYCVVHLSANGKAKTFKLHRLVAEAFVENPNCFDEINHMDENKQNNASSNLEWCTVKYNLTYGSRLSKISGSNNKIAKLQEKDVAFIRKSYVPHSKRYGVIALAQKYRVSTTTIKRVLRYETYKLSNKLEE